jgi:drug/metabolite transporter (DMT)-like permease
MLAVSVMLSLQSIAYKYVFEHGGDWVSIVSWSALLDFIFAGIAALYSGHLKDIAKQYAHHKNKIGSLFIIMQFLTWAGEQTQSFAISLIPVSIVKGVDNAQAIFVFLIAIAFSKRFPQLFQENLATSLRKKIILFAAMIVGILYTIFG